MPSSKGVPVASSSASGRVSWRRDSSQDFTGSMCVGFQNGAGTVMLRRRFDAMKGSSGDGMSGIVFVVGDVEMDVC